MMAMIGAFLSGTYTVLHSDRNLAISACVVPVAVSAYLGLTYIANSQLLNSFMLERKSTIPSFTVPGGFLADKGPDQGDPILTRNIAFKIFVLLNTSSMFLSSLAVFNHLAGSSATHVPDARELFKKMRLRRLLITFAMMAMIGASFQAHVQCYTMTEILPFLLVSCLRLCLQSFS
ncbi:hypothetical protein Q3G72_031494 [Acer saccharum]|nr:hypothetical protein Q3G72_012187 [Acer saccharum]KAK1589204.1 hypothetical protein Q3G72_031494 [Acer saccharum]